LAPDGPAEPPPNAAFTSNRTAIAFSGLPIPTPNSPRISSTKYRHFWHQNQGNPEARLKKLKVRQQRAQARARTVAHRTMRREETRRKILVGAVVLARVEQGLLEESVLRGWLEGAVERAEDRALFGLPEK